MAKSGTGNGQGLGSTLVENLWSDVYRQQPPPPQSTYSVTAHVRHVLRPQRTQPTLDIVGAYNFLMKSIQLDEHTLIN